MWRCGRHDGEQKCQRGPTLTSLPVLKIRDGTSADSAVLASAPNARLSSKRSDTNRKKRLPLHQAELDMPSGGDGGG